MTPTPVTWSERRITGGGMEELRAATRFLTPGGQEVRLDLLAHMPAPGTEGTPGYRATLRVGSHGWRWAGGVDAYGDRLGAAVVGSIPTMPPDDARYGREAYAAMLNYLNVETSALITDDRRPAWQVPVLLADPSALMRAATDPAHLPPLPEDGTKKVAPPNFWR